MTKNKATIRWARRVEPQKIKRLYKTDARGIVDEALIDDVGFALLERCESIRRVTEKCCPHCGESLHDAGPKTRRTRIVSCPQCDWENTWSRYHRSYKGERLHGGRAYPAFLTYLRQFPHCRTPQERMLCIDRLVHAVHKSVDDAFNSPGGQNVIQGKREDVRQLLDELVYGDTEKAKPSGARAEYLRSMRKGKIATADFFKRKQSNREQ